MTETKQETPPDLLKKKTVEIFTLAASLQEKIIEFAAAGNSSNKDAVDKINEQLKQLADRVSTGESTLKNAKEAIREQLFESISADVKKMKAETASAITEMQNAKTEMSTFKSEISAQMQAEKSRVAKFFEGILNLAKS